MITSLKPYLSINSLILMNLTKQHFESSLYVCRVKPSPTLYTEEYFEYERIPVLSTRMALIYYVEPSLCPSKRSVVVEPKISPWISPRFKGKGNGVVKVESVESVLKIEEIKDEFGVGKKLTKVWNMDMRNRRWCETHGVRWCSKMWE